MRNGGRPRFRSRERSNRVTSPQLAIDDHDITRKDDAAWCLARRVHGPEQRRQTVDLRPTSGIRCVLPKAPGTAHVCGRERQRHVGCRYCATTAMDGATGQTRHARAAAVAQVLAKRSKNFAAIGARDRSCRQRTGSSRTCVNAAVAVRSLHRRAIVLVIVTQGSPRRVVAVGCTAAVTSSDRGIEGSAFNGGAASHLRFRQTAGDVYRS